MASSCTDTPVVDAQVIGLVDAYDRAAPHLPRSVAIGLRNMVRKHPKLCLWGEDNRHPDNHITPDGEPSYWGGVRKDPAGKIVPGGRGPYPLALHRYLQARDSQERDTAGDPVFYRLGSTESAEIAGAGLRKKANPKSVVGKEVRRKAKRA